MTEGKEDKKEIKSGKGGKRIWLRVLGWAFVATIAVLAGTVAFLPTIATHIDYPELTFDLSTNITGNASNLISNKTVKVKIEARDNYEGGLAISAHGQILDWPFSAEANVNWTWRFLGIDAVGDVELKLHGSPWQMRADFTASSSGEWNASLEMPASLVDGNDPVTSAIVSRLDMEGVEDLEYAATVSIKAQAERTAKLPVSKWSAFARIKDCDISLTANGKPVSINGFRTGAGASGIDDHVDISPMFMHASCVEGAGLSISNVFASIRATETAFLVTEAGAKFCGGDVKLYSFFLDPTRLNAGLTLFLEGLDAGETLQHFRGFVGEASGKLHGKLPISLRNGNEISLGTAYLYSVPGETGTIKVYDANPIMESLALGGVTEDARENLSKALADLEYSTLNIQLQPEDKESMALSLRLDGSSTYGSTTVPVSFKVTFHGDIEQLLNTGLRATMRNNTRRRHEN